MKFELKFGFCISRTNGVSIVWWGHNEFGYSLGFNVPHRFGLAIGFWR